MSRHPTLVACAAGAAAATLMTIGAYSGHLDQVGPASVPYPVLVLGFVATLLRFAILPSRYPAITPRGGKRAVAGLTAGFLVAFAAVSSMSAGPGIALSVGISLVLGLTGIAMERR